MKWENPTDVPNWWMQAVEKMEKHIATLDLHDEWKAALMSVLEESNGCLDASLWYDQGSDRTEAAAMMVACADELGSLCTKIVESADQWGYDHEHRNDEPEEIRDRFLRGGQ